jgi:hypothetical protein
MQRAARTSCLRITAVIALSAAFAACSSTGPKTAVAITADPATTGQTATAGTATGEPVKVHVTDSKGAAVSGAIVSWAAATNSGTTGSATSTNAAPVCVKQEDRYGNGVPILDLTWGMSGGTFLGFTYAGPNSSDCIVLTLGSTKGLYTVVATVPPFASVTFSITGN